MTKNVKHTPHCGECGLDQQSVDRGEAAILGLQAESYARHTVCGHVGMYRMLGGPLCHVPGITLPDAPVPSPYVTWPVTVPIPPLRTERQSVHVAAVLERPQRADHDLPVVVEPPPCPSCVWSQANGYMPLCVHELGVN